MSQQSIEEILHQLKIGSLLEKRKANGKKFVREFFLDEHENFISYRGSRKTCRKTKIYSVKEITEIRQGFRAQTFGRLVNKGRVQLVDESRAFTIIYRNHRREIHLLAADSSTCDLWTRGLEHLIERSGKKTQRDLIKEENWILNHFRAADKDGSNTLTKRECRKLLTDCLNVRIPTEFFEKIFQKADKTREGLLSPDEFIEFFHLLTQRNELFELMKKNTKNRFEPSIEQIRMNDEELRDFLRDSQKNFYSIEKVRALIEEFELDEKSRQENLLTIDGFRNLLLSKEFDIIKTSLTENVYQDMTRPLCDYFINTSHNTYLFNSQISGASNPEAYNRVLLNGCRAVELDCYDGPDGMPIVTHGFTLVKPCSFESIIRYIEPNLFKTSPYPVILNIENHCSLEQQRQMGRILKQILKDRLFTKSSFNGRPTRLPSPEELKFKVLIRSRKNDKNSKENSDGSVSTEISDDDSDGFFPFFINVPFQDEIQAKENYSPFHSSSVAENRLEKIIREDSKSLLSQTSWRLIRVYPAGLRQDSSNFNPIEPWNYGVQMAALNQQNDDDVMPLSYGKFVDNGACGYVLKPKYLIDPDRSFYHPVKLNATLDVPVLLSITIISAQFLSRSNVNSSDIPDPYITISVRGLSCDEQSFRTKTIENNGLNPQWNEQFTFRVRFPQMALLCFSVYDADRFTRDDRLSYFSLPLTLIQTGFRHVHLRGKNNDPTHSTVFVHVDLQQESEDILRTVL